MEERWPHFPLHTYCNRQQREHIASLRIQSSERTFVVSEIHFSINYTLIRQREVQLSTSGHSLHSSSNYWKRTSRSSHHRRLYGTYRSLRVLCSENYCRFCEKEFSIRRQDQLCKVCNLSLEFFITLKLPAQFHYSCILIRKLEWYS